MYGEHTLHEWLLCMTSILLHLSLGARLDGLYRLASLDDGCPRFRNEDLASATHLIRSAAIRTAGPNPALHCFLFWFHAVGLLGARNTRPISRISLEVLGVVGAEGRRLPAAFAFAFGFVICLGRISYFLFYMV